MLAAGEGTRCYPFTYLSPKLFQQVGGIPLLEYMLSWFAGTLEIDRLYVVVRDGSIVDVLKSYVQKRKPYLGRIMSLFGQLGYKVNYVNPDFEVEVIEMTAPQGIADDGIRVRKVNPETGEMHGRSQEFVWGCGRRYFT